MPLKCPIVFRQIWLVRVCVVLRQTKSESQIEVASPVFLLYNVYHSVLRGLFRLQLQEVIYYYICEFFSAFLAKKRAAQDMRI